MLYEIKGFHNMFLEFRASKYTSIRAVSFVAYFDIFCIFSMAET
jgi:hypothetical protein